MVVHSFLRKRMVLLLLKECWCIPFARGYHLTQTVYIIFNPVSNLPILEMFVEKRVALQLQRTLHETDCLDLLQIQLWPMELFFPVSEKEEHPTAFYILIDSPRNSHMSLQRIKFYFCTWCILIVIFPFYSTKAAPWTLSK